MSKWCAGLAALIGMAAGAYVGMPYLEGSSCASASSTYVGCSLNRQLAPFAGAIVIGALAAVVAVHWMSALARRMPSPRQSRFEPLRADERPDPALEMASWGRTPAK